MAGWTPRQRRRWARRAGILLLGLALLFFLWIQTFSGRLFLFLLSFLAPAAFPNPLALVSKPPVTRRIAFPSASGRTMVADIHAPPGTRRRPGILLYSPAAREGLRNPAQRQFALSLARLGYVVMLPYPEGVEIPYVSTHDVTDAKAALERFLQLPEADPARSVGVAQSYGSGPLLLAVAGLPPLQTPSRLLVLAGYADLREFLRFATTGAFEYGDVQGRQDPHPYVRQVLMRSVIAWADPEDRAPLRAIFEGVRPETAGEPMRELSEEGRRIAAVLLNRDPDRFDALFARLPPDIRERFSEMSLKGKLNGLSVPVHISHPMDDLFVPPSEALRLWDVLPPEAKGSLILLPAMGHDLPSGPEILQRPLGYARSLWRIHRFMRQTLYPVPPA